MSDGAWLREFERKARREYKLLGAFIAASEEYERCFPVEEGPRPILVAVQPLAEAIRQATRHCSCCPSLGDATLAHIVQAVAAHLNAPVAPAPLHPEPPGAA